MSAGDLDHLHPVIRDLAQADDAARLLAIRSKRWITHQPAARVLDCLQDAFEQPPGDRMENLLLIAESGMGKTMLLRKFPVLCSNGHQPADARGAADLRKSGEVVM